MLHYESQVVSEHTHAKDFVLQEKMPPAALGIRGRHQKKRTGTSSFESAMILRTFLTVSIKGREHRCGLARPTVNLVALQWRAAGCFFRD